MLGRRRIFAMGTGMAVTPAAAQATIPPARAEGQRARGMAVGRNLVTGQDLGTKLCEIFGLDPSTVGKISIECSANDIAMIHVECAVYGDQSQEIGVALQNYGLAARNPEENS